MTWSWKIQTGKIVNEFFWKSLPPYRSRKWRCKVHSAPLGSTCFDNQTLHNPPVEQTYDWIHSFCYSRQTLTYLIWKWHHLNCKVFCFGILGTCFLSFNNHTDCLTPPSRTLQGSLFSPKIVFFSKTQYSGFLKGCKCSFYWKEWVFFLLKSPRLLQIGLKKA